jgi:hypothetical protein
VCKPGLVDVRPPPSHSDANPNNNRRDGAPDDDADRAGYRNRATDRNSATEPRNFHAGADRHADRYTGPDAHSHTHSDTYIYA